MEFHLKKAMIYDLDNTLYPVESIGDELFAPVLNLIREHRGDEDLDVIRQDLMRIPFQEVVKKHHFSPELKEACQNKLQDLSYDGDIERFEDYPAILELPGLRFLVTTGFHKMQQSKVTQMGLEKDFKAIHIIDPMKTDKTKKDVFLEILNTENLTAKDVMVIGDDPDSEIMAGKSLGMETVLYDKYDRYSQHPANHKIKDFRELVTILIN